MRLLGRAAGLRFAGQANLATFASANWVTAPFYSFEAPEDPGIIDDPLLNPGLNNAIEPIPGVRALPGGALQGEFPLDLNMLGHFLRMAFGTITTTGSNPNFVHTVTGAQDALPAYTLQLALNPTDVIQMRGCVLDRFGFSWRKEAGYARVRLGWAMRDKVNGSGWLAGSTAAALADARLVQARASATWGGSAIGDLLSVDFDHDNNLDRYETMSGDSFIAEIDKGLTAVTGKLLLRHRDNTFRAVGLADTAGALVIEITSAADVTNRRFTVTLPAVRLTAEGSAVSGPNGIDQRYSWRAEQGAGAPAVTLALRNGNAAAVYTP